MSAQGQAKGKTGSYRLIGCRDQTRASCKPKHCQNGTEGIAKMPCKCEANDKYSSRSRSGQISHGIKNNTSIVWHMFYGSFGTRSSMVTHIFISDSRSGQVQVKNVKLRKPNFPWNCTFLVQFCLNIPKSSFDLTFDNQKCQKIVFQKVTSSYLPGFWVIELPKMDIFAWNVVY